MKCYRKNGSDNGRRHDQVDGQAPSMKCYRKNGSDDGEPVTYGGEEVTPQ